MRRKILNFIGAGIVLALITSVVSCKKDPAYNSGTGTSTTTTTTNTTTTTTTATTDTTTYTLVWSDEFSGTSVDSKAWTMENRQPECE